MIVNVNYVIIVKGGHFMNNREKEITKAIVLEKWNVK